MNKFSKIRVFAFWYAWKSITVPCHYMIQEMIKKD